MRLRVRSLTFLGQQLEKAGLVSFRPPTHHYFATPQFQLEAMANLLVRNGDEVVALSDRGLIISSCDGQQPSPPSAAGDADDDQDRLPLESIGDFFDFALYSYCGGSQVDFNVYVKAVQRGLKIISDTKKSERDRPMNALTLLVVLSSLDALDARFRVVVHSPVAPGTDESPSRFLDVIKVLADSSQTRADILKHINECRAALHSTREAVGAFQRRESPAQSRSKVYKSAAKLIPALSKLRDLLKQFKDPELEASLREEVAKHAAAAVEEVTGASDYGAGIRLARTLLGGLEERVAHLSAVSLLYHSFGSYTAKPVMDGLCSTQAKVLTPESSSDVTIRVLPLLGLFGRDLNDQLEFILRKTMDSELSCLLAGEMPAAPTIHCEAQLAMQEPKAKWIGVSQPRCVACSDIIATIRDAEPGTGSNRIHAMQPPRELDIASLVDVSRALATHIYRSLDEGMIEREYERLREVEVVVGMELLGVEM